MVFKHINKKFLDVRVSGISRQPAHQSFFGHRLLKTLP
jgi:hypothetical protein